ncbi:MAG: hypothetical protein COX48_01165 [bacterium (Candidatus Stahlbacteria) CG23_combo_of_CG06-09_8_20_14_all_34_7]|nr:MAG: hypothetical protein COX48_01165 [bacterium (Candidatus Stahlbacteria) CG23_combo_of_CG06-09_8_20_14_all_34_7]
MRSIKIVLLICFLFQFCALQSQEISDIFKQVIMLENDAFDFYPEYGNILRGEGYIPDVDFEIMNEKYREFINDSNINPFYFVAYGFTFYYRKEADSAYFYFAKASELAGTDYAVHIRLYQIYSKHIIKYAMEKEIEQFENIKYKIGATALPEVAQYMNLSAIEEYNEKNPDRAVEYLILANKLDPYNPEIVENLFNFVIRERKFEYISNVFKMLKYQLSENFNKFVFIFNVLRYIRYLIFSVFIIMTIMFFVKITDKYFYLFKRFIRIQLDEKQKIVLGFIVLIVPLILQLNPIIWIFYISFISFLLIEKRERSMVIFMLLLVFLTPQIFRLENSILGIMNPNDNVSVIIKADNTYWDIKLLNKINNLIEEEPFNTSLLFAKAKLYKKGGYFEKAEEEYNKILLKNDQFAELYNNIGNIMFLKGYYSKAIENYQKAISISSELAQPYYNLGQVYLKKIELTLSDDYVEKAKEIDYDLISSFIENSEENYYNTEIIDCNIPESFIWNEFLKKKKVNDSPIMMGINISILSSLAIFLAIFSSVIVFLFGKKIKIERCETCGHPISEGDRRKYNETFICEKDYKGLKETLSDAFKARKFESLIRLRKKAFFKKRKIASILFPGFSKVLEGRTIKGYILVILTCSVILLLFSQKLFISKNPNLNMGIYFEYKYVYIAITLILYIMSFAITKEEK